TRTGRTVAIVVLSEALTANADRLRELARAVRAIAAVSHPNIAAVYEIGEDHGRAFLACEFVTGETLAAAMGGRPMNARRALDLGAQIADALSEAQAAGVADRRVTAETIVVTP